MNLIIFTAVVAVSAAAELPSNKYIPQEQSSDIHGQGQQYQSSGDSVNRRPQQDAEKNAAILKQEQEIGENGDYHFGFETSNGIRAEEAGNSESGQGGFSYKGDDGNTYTIIYTLGEGGFKPQGEHLPVAPPTPEAILQALQQNDRDEAAGIFDDGQYRPNEHGESQANSGSFASSSPNQAALGSSSQNSGYKY